MGKRSVENDLNDVSDHVLGDLDPDERIRMVMKTSHEDRDEDMEKLVETVPMRTYEIQDLEYRDAVQTVFVLSTHVKNRLRTVYRQICQYENGRDLNVALLMLNEALGFDRETDTDEVAERYGELWDETGLMLETPVEPARDTLPVVGMLAYPPDFSDVDLSDLDNVPDDPSEGTHEAAFYDLRLTRSVLDFYVVFHGARRLSEDVMDVSFDEFVDFAQTGPPGGALGTVEITEEWCRNILASYDEHLEYAASVAENEYQTANEVDPTELFDGRVKEWVLGVVEEWEKESFPFKEPE